MALQLHNTLSRSKQLFTPVDPGRVTLYQCGPTVYNYAHIGNARPAVVFDLLRRLLERHYPQVVFVRNITDVDDKINLAAEQAGVPIDQITGRFIDAYHADMAALGVGTPSEEPRATEHIGAIIAMIERLVASGHAYEAEGHVLFSVESCDTYGELSGRDLEQLLAGARVEVAPYKRHPGDFVLWKPSVDPQPGWDSPWGWGRPGWHIECSAMAEQHLGETIDIHAGGQDLVFPHHENEIAQSQCAHGGKIFARFWLHNGFVTAERRKMSKSLGNTLTVHELLKQHAGETLRYVLLGAHYRQPLDWSDATLLQAARTLDRLYTNLRDAGELLGELPAPAEPPAAMLQALEDDLNTPRALAILNQMGRELARCKDPEKARQAAASLLGAGALLGFLGQSPASWLSRNDDSLALDAAAIDQLVAERDAARANRDFARADEIRDQLTDLGVVLEDNPDGTRWKAGSGS